MKIGIIGGGVWGSAIAKLLSNNKVCIITRDTKIVKSINEHRFNPRLKYAVFNENVSATTDLNACKSQNLENSKIVVFKDGVLTKIEETLNSFKWFI